MVRAPKIRFYYFSSSLLKSSRKLCLIIYHYSKKCYESESLSVMSDSLRPHGLYSPWNSPGQNTGVGSLSLLQEIFPTQGSNPGLPNCRQILYQLSHKGGLKKLLGKDICMKQYSFYSWSLTVILSNEKFSKKMNWKGGS